MSKLKDKLSANMRNVRENPPSGSSGAQPQAAEHPAAKPAPKAPPHKAKKPAPATGGASGNEVHDSGGELFPSRVWPD